MKTLAQYKADYKARKTLEGKKNVMNKAMLNLSYNDQQAFIKWQVDQQTN